MKTAHRRALICGISGQDGPYLAHLLLQKGYQVWGTSRDVGARDFLGLHALGIRDQVNIVSMALDKSQDVIKTVERIAPDEIYNLAGQSSVGASFQHPHETAQSVLLGTLNLLEAIRVAGGAVRFFNAGSSECFGNTGGVPADETTPFRPQSPYGVAKAAATWEVAVYRDAYDLFACTGILFNHESPLRPDRFVSRKIVSAACRIASGSREKLTLGNIEVRRDWGWAPEYVDAMWRMLNVPECLGDFVIATGVTQSLGEFVEAVFAEAGLEWMDHVSIDGGLRRPLEPREIRGSIDRAKKLLSWRPEIVGAEVPRKMFRMMCESSSNSCDVER